MSESNSESEERPPSQEVFLDKESERRLVNAVAQAVREGKVSPASSASETPPELSEEELSALTDVIDEYVDKRVSERMSGEEKPATPDEQQKRVKETVDEVAKYGRQGLSQLLRIRYEAERAAKNKAE